MWVKCSWDAQEIDGGLANDRGKDPISTIIVTRWAEQAVEFGFSHRILKKSLGIPVGCVGKLAQVAHVLH